VFIGEYTLVIVVAVLYMVLDTPPVSQPTVSKKWRVICYGSHTSWKVLVFLIGISRT